MKTYIALLRGINVSGQKLIRMQDLRESLAKLPIHNVRTYVQSGNVVFEAAKITSVQLSQRIQRDFGFSVEVVLRTAQELERVLKANPFLKEKVDPTRLYVTFLSAKPSQAALKALQAKAPPREQFRAKGKELYLHFPDGYGRSKLNNNTIEKVLGLEATTRNWNTVGNLCKMCKGPALD